MASGPNRSNDSDTSTNQNGQDNPFIKFRRFADSQISSFLQGIVGLPSAFAKSPNANGRWAEIDEDLRRRDGLQSRQQQLREADVERPGAKPLQQNEELPSRQRTEIGTYAQEDSLTPSSEPLYHDLPLYSPVHKSLFSHLRERGEDERDWKPTNLLDALSDASLLPQYWPLKLRQEQASPDVLKTIQYLAYNEVNSEPLFSSEYSLLPYLLFSSYSPLKLSADAQSPTSGVKDRFEYCAAFEDLVKTTSGRPLENPPIQFSIFHGNPITQSSVDGMSWIQKLYGIGILQQKQTIGTYERISWPGPWSRPTLVTGATYSKEPESELEMYERFLKSMSMPTERPTVPLEEFVGSILREGEATFQKFLRDFESPEGKNALKESLSSVMKDAREFTDALLSTSVAEDNMEKVKSMKDRGENTPGVASISNQDTVRVTSSSTTSEHHTNEDGSVETTVTVWKRYADGRESCTTTSHMEDPPANYAHEKNEKQAVPKPSDPKAATGWFWN